MLICEEILQIHMSIKTKQISNLERIHCDKNKHVFSTIMEKLMIFKDVKILLPSSGFLLSQTSFENHIGVLWWLALSLLDQDFVVFCEKVANLEYTIFNCNDLIKIFTQPK